MHGVRSVEVVRALRPDLDAVVESEAIERRQAEDVEGLRAIPGRRRGASGIEGGPGRGRDLGHAAARARRGWAPWASSRRAVVVFADDVARGKPDPEGYLTAASRLGVEPGEALVVEDAPPGIEAGRAAGAATVGVTSTHAAPSSRRRMW